MMSTTTSSKTLLLSLVVATLFGSALALDEVSIAFQFTTIEGGSCSLAEQVHIDRVIDHAIDLSKEKDLAFPVQNFFDILSPLGDHPVPNINNIGALTAENGGEGGLHVGKETVEGEKWSHFEIDEKGDMEEVKEYYEDAEGRRSLLKEFAEEYAEELFPVVRKQDRRELCERYCSSECAILCTTATNSINCRCCSCCNGCGRRRRMLRKLEASGLSDEEMVEVATKMKDRAIEGLEGWDEIAERRAAQRNMFMKKFGRQHEWNGSVTKRLVNCLARPYGVTVVLQRNGEETIFSSKLDEEEEEEETQEIEEEAKEEDGDEVDEDGDEGDE